jgi:hypothetical protein
MAETHLPIPSSARPVEDRNPVASEPTAADRAPGPWFEARWQDRQTGTWQGEPYERFWAARTRVLEEHNRGAQAVYVVHVPTGEVVFAVERGRVAPGCRLGDRPPVPPR